MAATMTRSDITVGTELPVLTVPIQRVNLIMYAGVSGDFNPIHWNERIATAVGLPNVIAHGMLTMATASRLVTSWAGDPGAVTAYRVRFSKPVVVPDDDQGATLRVSGEVTAIDEAGRATVELTTSANSSGMEEAEVLQNAVAVVQLGD